MLSPEIHCVHRLGRYGRTRGCQQLACCNPCGDCDRNIDRGAFDQPTVIAAAHSACIQPSAVSPPLMTSGGNGWMPAGPICKVRPRRTLRPSTDKQIKLMTTFSGD